MFRDVAGKYLNLDWYLFESFLSEVLYDLSWKETSPLSLLFHPNIGDKSLGTIFWQINYLSSSYLQ